MLYETEQKVIGASLHDPGLFTRHGLELDWVTNEENKLIIQAITNLDGQFTDFGEVLAEMKQMNPLTTVSESKLEQLSFHYFDLKSYETSTNLLKMQYYEERVKQAVERYGFNPTKDNYDTLKDRIREKEEAETPQKDGTLTEANERLKDRMENGTEPGILTYPKLDEILGGGLHSETLITIGARPSVGKTAYVINLICQMLVNQPDIQIDFFTLEMGEDQMFNRFISRFSDVSSYKLRNPKTEIDEKKRNRILSDGEHLAQTGLRIYDSLINIKDIEKQIRRRQHEHQDGQYIAIIDYLGLIETNHPQFGRQAEISQITRTLKKLTNTLKIPIIILSQLNRDLEKRQEKRPTLADLRDSGSIEQDSNIVGFLYRDEEESNTVKLFIAKNREGITFTIDYNFIGSKMYFEEMD